MSQHRGTFHRLPRSVMEPLRITAWLQSGVVSDHTLPIDSVLWYQAMREQYESQDITWSGSDHPERVTGVQLPVARCEEHGPMWYYAASFAQWPEEHADGQDHWNKRFGVSLASLVDFRGRRGKIDTSAAAYKAYHMPVWYRHARYVRWYVFGHQESIERLLPHCTHLGKKISQGWGQVLRWDCEPWPHDWSVRGTDGKLMRAVPAAQGILTGYRPSYWLPKNQTVCEMPSEEALTSPDES